MLTLCCNSRALFSKSVFSPKPGKSFTKAHSCHPRNPHPLSMPRVGGRTVGRQFELPFFWINHRLTGRTHFIVLPCFKKENSDDLTQHSHFSFTLCNSTFLQGQRQGATHPKAPRASAAASSTPSPNVIWTLIPHTVHEQQLQRYSSPENVCPFIIYDSARNKKEISRATRCFNTIFLMSWILEHAIFTAYLLNYYDSVLPTQHHF